MELSGLSNAANKLSSILRDSVGIIIDPLKKIVDTEAELHAEKRKVTKQLEIDSISLINRAKLKQLEMDLQRQYNFENICWHAINNLDANAKPELLNQDWLHRFFSASQDTSEEELRILWGKILAQECSQESSISKLTIEKLKIMAISDCRLFEKLCCKVVSASNRKYSILLKFRDRTNFNDLYDFDYSDFSHLCDLGLVNNSDIAVFNLPANNGTLDIVLPDGTRQYLVNKSKESYSLNFYFLTTAGREINNILKCENDINFFNNIFAFLRTEKISLETHNEIQTINTFLDGKKPD